MKPESPEPPETGALVFYVNGARQVVNDPDPRTLLLDYLRSDEIGLTGTKKVCAQGGCGACTVTLHRYDPQAQAIENLAVNACLRPICSLDGMAITTVEGVGSVTTEISPVQNQLIVDGGSQCGYCTPGWVMSMHSYLVQHPQAKLDQRQVEELFDGNLCRCTGYRPILYAMRHFASNFGPADQVGCMKLYLDPALAPKVAAVEPNQVPTAIEAPPRRLQFERDGYTWIRPLDLAELMTVLAGYRDPTEVRLVAGNTSIGIYGEPAQGVTIGPPHVRIDIAHLPELRGCTVDTGVLVVGGATTYTELVEWLPTVIASAPVEQLPALDALHYMARRTAGRIVRDAATLAGNTMLVVSHVERGTPFPSDLFTALLALGTQVVVVAPGWTAPQPLDLLDFAARWQAEPALQLGGVILRYLIPLPGVWARTFKVALREVNAHSIVNGGFTVALDDARVVQATTAVLGGIGPVAFYLDELQTWLTGRRWDADTLAGGLARVRTAVADRLARAHDRMRDVPDEGFTDAYRIELAESFFYQWFVWVAERVFPDEVAPDVKSAALRRRRPASHGTQRIQTYPAEFPVSRPMVKIEGFQQATGEARYTHDLPRPGRGVDAALVVSTCALAPRWSFAIPGDGAGAAPRPVPVDELVAFLRVRFPGFIDLVTAADIPGKNDQQWAGPPDPLLCPPASGVTACGQALALAIADDARTAIDAAWWVQTHAIAYAPAVDGAGQPVAPVLRLVDAIANQQFITDAGTIKAIVRPGSHFEWVADDEAIIDGIHCRVVRGRQQSVSPQLHFYLETQSAIAIPGERGPTSMRVQTSTQNPDTVAGAVKAALGLTSNLVEVEIQRLGGGYGGKGPRTPWCAAIAAVAAHKLGRPVRLDVTRETDSALFGHSNPLLGQYAIAIATGADDPDRRGRIMGVSTDFWLDAGNTADCSPIVMDCVLLRSDNAYFVPNYQVTGEVCVTNTISNTSFRSLEAVSGILVLEDAIEHAAHTIGMSPEEVRTRNLYHLGDLTPTGQVLDYCYMTEVWRYTQASWKELRLRSSFAERAATIDDFNAGNRWRKRGISLVPIKYGMGFNLASMERGDALVDIYSDGTILVRHGGVEMGQGLNTQITQLVAQALNVPLAMIQIGVTSTAVIPDPTSTGASTGTAFNGGAAQAAAQRLRRRLEAFCMTMLREHGRDDCAAQHLDFWSYDDGWRHPIDPGGGAPAKPLWCYVVSAAGAARVNLSTQAQHDERGGENPDTGLEFWSKQHETSQQFVGFTYSAGISEVEVDILTGEVTILRSDLVYDMGKSLNPATDVGQIEGAFLQGVGRVLTENIVCQPSGPLAGLNNTPNTWGYKIPATTTVPLELNVNLFPRDLAPAVPENPNLLLSAKESGEPPLCLAITVYLALKHAIHASRRERNLPDWFPLDLPCTVQSIRAACAVAPADLDLTARATETAPPPGPAAASGAAGSPD